MHERVRYKVNCLHPLMTTAKLFCYRLHTEEQLERREVQERGAYFRSRAVREANLSKIDALYECCNAFYKAEGDGATTVSCPKANLLRHVYWLYHFWDYFADLRRLKMKQRAQGIS